MTKATEGAATADFLTVLTSKSLPLCKSFRCVDGEVVASVYAFPWQYKSEAVAVASLKDLAAALAKIELDRQSCVISGRLADDVPPDDVRRTKDNFEPQAHRWVMLDIDDLEPPERLAPVASNAQELVAAAVAALPAEFSGVDCYYQFSGSMGIKPGIRVHLWFWLSRPVKDEEKKAWLAGSPVDLRLFNSIQLHFTAHPTFEGDVVDPFAERSGMFEAGRGISEVVVPDELAQRVDHLRGTGSGKGSGGGPHEIVRDPETGLAIDGREALMFQLSNEVMLELCVGGVVPNLNEITDRLWERFQHEADLTIVNERGAWTRKDAEAKARHRLEEKVSGEFTFQARSQEIGLFPSGPSPYESPLVSPEEGQVQLQLALDRFFDDVDAGKTPRDLIRITMGAGKTKGTIRKLKEFLKHRSGRLVEVYVPRHDLIEEWKHSLEAGDEGAVNAVVVHIKPRTGGTPKAGSTELPFEPLCDRADYVRDLEQKGYPVFGTACLNAEAGEQCEFFGTCRYLQQFRLSEGGEVGSGNVIRLYTHAHLALPRNEDERETVPALVVVDENPLPTLAAPDAFPEVPIAQIATHIASDRVPNLGGELAGDFYSPDGLAWLARLRSHSISNGQLEAIGRKITAPKIPFDRSRKSPSNATDARHLRGLRALIQVLREELRFKERLHPERLVTNRERSGVVVCLAKECRISDQEPLLVLDATATSLVAEKLFGPLREARISIRQQAHVTQVYDRTGSNSSWDKKVAGKENYEDVATLIEVLKGWVQYGSRPLVVGHKGLADHLRQKIEQDSGIAVAHFQALRGSNDYEDCDIVFITGRNAPPYDVVDRQGRALFWDDSRRLFHDDLTGRLPAKLVGYWPGEGLEGRQVGILVEDFTDSRLSALNEQVRQSETAQAIARLRLVWASAPKRVFLLGNLPVEMPVDRLVGFDELMPDKLERELLAKGDIPLTARGIVQMRPDLYTSENAAREALRGSLVETPQKLMSFLPELARASLMVATFRPPGTTRDHKHLFMTKEFELADGVMSWQADLSTIRSHLETGWGKGNVNQLRLEEVVMGGDVHRPTRQEMDAYFATEGEEGPQNIL